MCHWDDYGDYFENFDDAKRFFKNISKHIKQVNSYNPVHRRLILCSLIDALAKAGFPLEHANRDRFVKVIDDYSGWEHKDRVSLPQLVLLIEECRAGEHCPELYAEATRRLSLWEHGDIIYADSDPWQNDLIEFHGEFNRDDCKQLIDRCRYASLVYQARNYYIHELRKPGDSFPLSGETHAPQYTGLLDNDGEWKTWKLQFHPDVLYSIAKGAADNLKKHMIKNNINPFDNFPSRSLWIDPTHLKKKFNKK